MVEESKDYSVTKVVPYSSRYSQNMKDAMAILKFNTGWQNRFSEFEGAINFLDDTKSAMDKGLINLDRVPDHRKSEITMDMKRYYQIKRLWEGDCFITRDRDPMYPTRFIPGSDRFHYDSRNIDFNDNHLEIIPLPSLDDMTPIGRIRDETLLIQISANVKLYLAYDMMDFETLIREGGLYHMENGNLKAKFSPEDMNSKIIETYKVGRSYFFKTMNIMKRKFFENWSPLKIDLHRLIVFQELQEQLFDADLMESYQNAQEDAIPQSKEIQELEDKYDYEGDFHQKYKVQKELEKVQKKIELPVPT